MDGISQKKKDSYINAAQSVRACMCEHEHTVSHVQKRNAHYDHKYMHMRNCTHAHDTVGFSNTACQSVCTYAASGCYWARPRPRQSLCVGVGWACGSESWPLYRPAERVRCVPLMSFLGQARPWGELISKQATERSPYSPLLLLPPPPPPLLAMQLITLSLCLLLSIVFSYSLFLSL